MVPTPTPPPFRVAILDLYDGEPNQGMRAIHELLTALSGRLYGQPLTFDVFETRLRGDLPGLQYDAYLSSGGPGSPYDGAGTRWEHDWFQWVETVWNHNDRHRGQGDQKHVLFICHSFQLMCRFFDVADVTRRKSEAFGVFPVHPTEAGKHDPLFNGLDDPFYAADFRHWQAVQPDEHRLADLGASVLALEKIRPHVALERAVMALRITPELVGTQFHPEADPPGMRRHFAKAERRRKIVTTHGEEKYHRTMHRLRAPAFLKRTHDAVIPNFLRGALTALRPEWAPPALPADA